MRKLFLTLPVKMLTGAWLLAATLCLAAPNTDDSGDALETRSEPELKQLATEAAAEYKTANELITEMLQKVEEGQPDKINPKSIGTSWVATYRMERFGQALEDAGETAGLDFQIRSQILRKDLRRVMKQYHDATGLNAKLPAIYAQLKANAQRRARELEGVKRLVDQQDWEKASELVHEQIEELDELGCWMTDAKRAPLFPFETLREQIMPKLREQRSAAAQEKLAELRDQITPDYAQLLSQLQQGAKDLRAGKDPTFDGQQYSGPEFLQQAGESWKQLHHQGLQSLGIDWSRGLRLGEDDPQPLQDLLQSQKDFSSQIISAMAGVISADAEGGSSADPSAKYAAYVQALAPLISLTENPRNTEILQTALDTLAAKTPSLAADVKAYDAATGELLRWKKRLAAAQQQSLAAEYPDFAAKAMPSLKNESSDDPNSALTSTGLLDRDATKLRELAVIASVPASLERMKPDLLGKQVTLPAATGIVPAKKLVASRYANRHYATFNLPAGYEEQVAALKAALLVSDNLPPLTLKAAMAIAAAERGDLQSAGVTINRIYVEPLPTRMVTLPAVASSLVPLGTLPEESMGEPSLAQLLLRSDVQPNWVRNQYFFVPPQP